MTAPMSAATMTTTAATMTTVPACAMTWGRHVFLLFGRQRGQGIRCGRRDIFYQVGPVEERRGKLHVARRHEDPLVAARAARFIHRVSMRKPMAAVLLDPQAESTKPKGAAL
jgi:hypothetical protein